MSNEKIVKYDYSVVPTIKAFTLDNHFVKGIKGPIGSGKSSGCVMDLLNRAFTQQPDSDGVRRTRFAIIRNSYQQLKDTTKKTAEEWMPFTTWKEYEHKLIIDIKQPDGTLVNSEWLFRALDRPDQIAQLLSMELTGAWLNEAKELPKEVFDTIQSRVGRYPKVILDENDNMVYGPTWFGVIADTNPPDTDHWWYKFFEEVQPDNSIIFSQPSGVSEDAENLKYLPKNYYTNIMKGKDPDWVKVYVEGNYGYLKEGRPVFPNYNDQIHIFTPEMKPIKGIPLVIGMDFGLTPACIITQLDPKNRLWILDEIQSESMAIREFCEKLLKPLLRNKYLGFEHIIIGDPAGTIRSQVDAVTVYQELRAQGLKAKPARTNAIQPRLASVNTFLTRMIEGKPAFFLSQNCKVIRKALSGGYAFRRLKTSGERYTDVPDKNEFSHIADCLQYACLEHETGFDAFTKYNVQTSGVKPVEPDKRGWT